jgi:hypothetical protein
MQTYTSFLGCLHVHGEVSLASVCNVTSTKEVAVQEYINAHRRQQRVLLKQAAAKQARVLGAWASLAQSQRLHSVHQTSLYATVLQGTAEAIVVAWRNVCAANRLCCSLLQRRALHAWTTLVKEKKFWCSTLTHARTAMQHYRCMQCFLAWRDSVICSRTKLAAFARKQRALRSALAAGRSLARLHHNSLLASCMHVWHARTCRHIRSRTLLYQATMKSASRCWSRWVKYVKRVQSLRSSQLAVAASRRHRTLHKVLTAWYRVSLESVQTREETAVAALWHMQDWKSSCVFVAWASLAANRRQLVLRMQVLAFPPALCVLVEEH